MAEEGKRHKKWERALSQKSGIDAVKLYQKEFKTIKKNMDEILKLMELVKALAPRGVSDFLDLYFKAFNETNEICKTVCDYADRIVKEIKNVETLWDQAINNENSYFFMRMEYLPRRSQ